jgi:hypothetical protein
MGEHIVGNSDASVGNGNRYVVAGVRILGPQRIDVDNGIERLNAQAALAQHRVPGVNGQIQHDQLDLRRIDEGAPETGLTAYLQLYSGPECGAEQVSHADKLAAQIDYLGLKPLFARKCQQLPGEFGTFLSRGSDQFKSFLLIGVPDRAQQ